MRGHLRYVLTVGLSVLVVASLAAVHPDQPEAAPGAGLPNGFGRAVFLSHVNDPDSVSLFPGDPEFVIEQVASVEADGFYMNKVSEGEHTGTHFSAPCHFHDGERCADQLAARDFFFPAVVIDVRTAARANADYAISVGDVKAFERRHGRIPAGAAVIAWTGWQDKWGTPAYFNYGADGETVHQPGFSIEAARWLLRHRAIRALGTDTFGPDLGIDPEFQVTTLILHQRRFTLENLTGLQRMPANGGWIVVGGPRNKRGSGAPSTIFGLTR
jgi:kynurenine formamidase